MRVVIGKWALIALIASVAIAAASQSRFPQAGSEAKSTPEHSDPQPAARAPISQTVQAIKEFSVPGGGSPVFIAMGKDAGCGKPVCPNALWFGDDPIERSDNSWLGEIRTDGTVVQKTISTGIASWAYFGGIAMGPDGSMWVSGYKSGTLQNHPEVWRIEPNGDVNTFDLAGNGFTWGMVAAPDGNLWFLLTNGSKRYLCTMTRDGLLTATHDLGSYFPAYLTLGGDGALWMTQSSDPATNAPALILRYSDGEIKPYPIPSPQAGVAGITAGPDGALWFTEDWGISQVQAYQGSKIGRITTKGAITEYPLSGYSGVSYGGTMTTGPDGALWFMEVAAGNVGRITTSGAITEYPVPGLNIHDGPFSITAGPNNDLWFGQKSQIGEIQLTPSPRNTLGRPIPMGVSVGNTPGGLTGTAGLLVHDAGNSSKKYILSANHVLGSISPTDCVDTALKGHTTTLQPSVADIGSDPGNSQIFAVGTVHDYVSTLTFGVNKVDAAIASTTTALASAEILGIGMPNAQIGTAKLGESVIKSGRTSGVTVGTVIAVNSSTVFTATEASGCPTLRFSGQDVVFGASPGIHFVWEGDSGASVLDSETKTPIGLIMSENTKGWTLVNPIAEVYRQLGIAPEGAPRSPDSDSSVLNTEIEPELRRVEDIQARHEDELFAIPGVVGVGIGLGSGTKYEFLVFVEHKTPESTRNIPSTVEGTSVRIMDTGGGFKLF